MKLTASDKSNLIKLAHSLPKSSEERRAILSGLKTAGVIPGVQDGTGPCAEDPECECPLEEKAVLASAQTLDISGMSAKDAQQALRDAPAGLTLISKGRVLGVTMAFGYATKKGGSVRLMSWDIISGKKTELWFDKDDLRVLNSL